MKKLYSLAVAVASALTFGIQTSYALTTETYTPTGTTVIQADGKSVTNADKVFYDATATSWNCSQSVLKDGAFTNAQSAYDGTPIVLSQFNLASTLSDKVVLKATLSFKSVCTVSGKNSNVQVAAINTGWDVATATWTNTNTADVLKAENINGNGTNVTSSEKTLTLDVTDYFAATKNRGFAFYTYTAREQKISDIKLEVDYIQAALAANYVVKYVDANGNELKGSSTRIDEKGVAASLKASDKDAIYSEDGSVKYVYDSDDAEGKTIAEDGSTVITIKFRAAEKWNYTFNAVDKDGNVLQEGIVKGTNFEGETFSVGYPYAINVDSVLYTSPKLSSDKKGFYMSFTLDQADKVQNVTFSPTTTTRVAFYSEAENIEGLTKADNSNTVIRSSNGASAYAAENDVEIVKLPAGAYKLTANICDATKNHDSKWNFLAGNDTIFTFTPASVNWSQGTSEEFTINKTTSIILAKGGSKNAAVDFIYIQKTGDVEAVEPEEPAMTLPEAGTYYIKNVATGKYFAAGNSWGSQAIVNDHGMDVKLALADGKYTLDTQISNGGEKHFLGTNLFTDNTATPFVLALTKTADGKDAITISDGAKFVAAQADNSSLVSVDEAADDYAKWVFVSDSARLAELANATADNGIDATWLLKGYNFGRNDQRNANWQGSPKLGGDNTNFNAEKYNTDFDVYQTITVPKGKYTVEAQAYYRNGSIAASAAAHLDGTEKLLATLYANTSEIAVPSIYSDAGKVDTGSTADGIEGKFPNSQGEASAFFTAGAYNVVLENVNVVDGTLRVGLKKSETTDQDWTCFDNIRLTYYGEVSDVAVFKEEYEKALAAAKAAVADEANAVVTGEELATLNAVIEQNSTVAEDTKEAYQAAAAALNEAKSAFTDAKVAYQSLADTKAQYKDFDFASYKYADQGIKSAVNRSLSATPKTAADATQLAQNVVSNIRLFVESNAAAVGVEDAEPATEIIQNPNAEATEGWTLNSTVGTGNKIEILSKEPLTDSEGGTAYPYFDGGNWGANAWDLTYTQTSLLPRGKYLLSVFSRASAELSTFDLIANVVADNNGGIAPLDGEIAVEPGDGDNTGDSEVAADTVKFTAPMQHIGASGGIFGRGWNNTVLEFDVDADWASVELGIHGATQTLHNWMSFTSFQLTRLSAAEEEQIVDVENIAALKAMAESTEKTDFSVKLKLTDAKVTVFENGDYGVEYAVIEDATGALNISPLLDEGLGMGYLSADNFKVGTVLNGYVYGEFSYPYSLYGIENSSESELTYTAGTATPTEATLSEVLKPENAYRYYTFKNVKAETTGEGDRVLVASESVNVPINTIADFAVVPETWPTEFESISGILTAGYYDLGEAPTSYMFIPLAYTLKTTGISSIEQAAQTADVYTVNGVKVRAAGESTKGLAKGIYVVGGKKIVVK